MPTNDVVWATPYSNEMPNNVKPDDSPPMMKYLTAASAPLASLFLKATRAYEDMLVISIPMNRVIRSVELATTIMPTMAIITRE